LPLFVSEGARLNLRPDRGLAAQGAEATHAVFA
jgi:hypothetical protein